MAILRRPAVAGSFYPETAAELHTLVQSLLSAAHAGGPQPKAIIAPHAGYIYSGPIAASVYARLKPHAHKITRVILLGPSHYIALRGLAYPDVDFFSTPLGNIPVDRAALRLILDLPDVRLSNEAHAQEHCLEVQLPFLQEISNSFSVVPLVAGEIAPHRVAQVLNRLWGHDETLIVISSDLSHYRHYTRAQQQDAATSRAIEQLRFESLSSAAACGSACIGGLLYVARQRGLQAHAIDVRNSGDTAGPHDRVVGYGAYALH